MGLFLESGIHWQLINFAIFIVLLVVYLKKPIAEFWESRSHSISFALIEAQNLRKESGKRLFELEGRITRIDKEGEELIASLAREGELEQKKMIEAAESRADWMKRESIRIMDQEVQKVREQLKRQLVDLSVDLARQRLAEAIQLSDQKRFHENFLREVEQLP